jgi:Flp pilus assembly CpaE family ATPase
VIAVVGAKGGDGASTVAHNLAWSLASLTEMSTIIADFDLAFGTAGLDYNQDPLNNCDIAWTKSTTSKGATRYSLTPRAVSCR